MKFIVKHKEESGYEIREKIVNFLEKKGAEWTSDTAAGADFAIIIGGDGTLFRFNAEIKCPVLGVNPGQSIGHYMRACRDDYEKKLLKLIKGKKGKDYYVYDLLRLETRVNGKKMRATALNDVLVSPIYVRRALKAVLKAGGKLSEETNSGIIIYTPTGSTAFAHSAGARKIDYRKRVMGVTALAPYRGALKEGEIIVNRGSVRIEYLSGEGEVCIDGNELNLHRLKKGDIVEVSKYGCHLQLVGFRKSFGE
ncbi:MAG: NAD(+)/NADH kinase [Candidatus Aenigmatarchaeota archaeon]|nr:MAG: NAD(+)/NADH kinase [Candidatus Aenigmarchaeota archaeon]